MGSKKYKILIVSALSMAVVFCTLIAAAIVSENYRKGGKEEFLQTQYSSFHETASESVSSSSSSQQESSDDNTSSEPIVAVYPAGIYKNENNSVTIYSSENGFVEGNVLCGEITMEFSGQQVDGVLVVTSNDSHNNTIELKLTYENGKITADSKVVALSEENAEYLSVSGIFE